MIRAFFALLRLFRQKELPIPTGPIECMGRAGAPDPQLVSDADCIRAEWCRKDGDAEGYAFFMLSAAGFTREIKTTYHRN